MASISIISSNTPVFIQNAPIRNSNNWTDVKVRQACLTVLAGISFIGGALFAVAMPIAAVPLLLASGGMLWYSASLIDYENPGVLAALRAKAEQMTLPQIVKKHGWDKLFSYAILDASGFDAAYGAHADTLSFREILDYYEEARSGLSGSICKVQEAQLFAIPSPWYWKEKFDLETKSLRCDAIVKNYPLDKLASFCIVTENQQKTLESASEAIRRLSQRGSELEQQFRDRTPYQHAALHQARNQAELSFKAHPAHLILAQIDADEGMDLSNMRRSIQNRISLEESSLNCLLARRGCLTPCEQNELACRERQVSCAIRQLRDEECGAASNIRHSAEIRRLPAQQALSFARELRDRLIADAEELFRIETLPVRREIDALQSIAQTTYEKSIAALDLEYRK